MIDRINLIPQEVLEARALRRTISYVALGSLVGVFLMVLWWGYLNVSVSLLREELNHTRTKKAAIDARIAVLKVYEDRRTELDQREKRVEELQTGEIDWASILSDMGGIVPSNLWLTKISASDNNLQLEGISLKYQDLASYVIRLNNTEFLTDTVLLSYEDATEEIGTDALKFTILAKAKPEAKEK